MDQWLITIFSKTHSFSFDYVTWPMVFLRMFVYNFIVGMADVAQLVRALGCGPRGRRFKSGRSPHKNNQNIHFIIDLF